MNLFGIGGFELIIIFLVGLFIVALIAKPNLIAILKTSSSEENLYKGATGPKVSSYVIFAFVVTFDKIVGL